MPETACRIEAAAEAEGRREAAAAKILFAALRRADRRHQGSPEVVVVAGILLALVETALRNVVRKISANKLSNPNGPTCRSIPNCDEVQQLKSAAMPLLFQLRDDQKEEVRKLARIIGLEKVAQQI